jgi:hypothetical protein
MEENHLLKRLSETEAEAAELTKRHQAGDLDRAGYLTALEDLARERAGLKNLLPVPPFARLIAAITAGLMAWQSYGREDRGEP